jgi:hypothetical protein
VLGHGRGQLLEIKVQKPCKRSTRHNFGVLRKKIAQFGQKIAQLGQKIAQNGALLNRIFFPTKLLIRIWKF